MRLMRLLWHEAEGALMRLLHTYFDVVLMAVVLMCGGPNLCCCLTSLGATAGVTIGALVTVGVAGAAVAVLVAVLVARQRRR